ncbi:TPA: AbrB/MazE/SpoVT family DNA-binding domain-containing protein [Pseudomonas aeruginosa]
MPINLPIENWDGEPALRLPDEVLQRLDLQVGDSLYLVEAWVGDGPRLVLSKTPKIPDRVDALVAQWERELAEEQIQATPPDSTKDE